MQAIKCHELNSKTSEDPFYGVQLSGVAGWTFKSTDYKQLNVSSSLFTWNLSMNLAYKPLLLSTQVRNQTFFTDHASVLALSCNKYLQI